MTQITLDIPDELAQEAGEFDLLNAAALVEILREEVDRRVMGMVNAEIQACRAENGKFERSPKIFLFSINQSPVEYGTPWLACKSLSSAKRAVVEALQRMGLAPRRGIRPLRRFYNGWLYMPDSDDDWSSDDPAWRLSIVGENAIDTRFAWIWTIEMDSKSTDMGTETDE